MRLRNMEHPHYMRTPYTPIYRGAASKARYHEFSLFFCMTYTRYEIYMRSELQIRVP